MCIYLLQFPLVLPVTISTIVLLQGVECYELSRALVFTDDEQDAEAPFYTISSHQQQYDMDVGIGIPQFKSLDTDPGGTLKRFKEYVDQMKLLHQLLFRKADGTPYTPTDAEKKALMLLKGGKDMKILYDHVGKVLENDSFDATVTKITDGLSSRTNQVVQRNALLTGFPQGSKSFERWQQEITDAAKLISYTGYNWEQAAVDAILLQTSNAKLRERALQENITFENLIKLGIAKEQSVKGAAFLEKVSGQTPLEEEVRRL